MKKNIIHILFALLPLLSVAQKQDLSTLPDLFEGTKICLDPGHGGHDSDDRETQVGYGIIYWESDGVFAQANYASEILEALGADVKVTRHTNDSHAEDRQPSLSERVAMGNAFDADIFHSIHTNGSSDKNVNYTCVLKYKTPGAYETEIDRMIAIMNPSIYDVVYTTAERTWGQGLGVLNGNNQPAILSEAAFHSNSKEGRRLNNSMYQKALAYSYVRSFIDYFNLEDYSTGEIGGIVLYSNYKSANIAKLSLFSSDGTFVESKYTDIGYNGFFMFDLLTPGTYSVTVEVEGVDMMTIEDVQVQEGSYTQSDIVLDSSPAYVVNYAPQIAFVGNTLGDGVEVKWHRSNLTDLTGYNVYYSNDNVSWSLVADESTLDASATSTLVENESGFLEPGAGTAKYFKVQAISSTEPSVESEFFVKNKLSGDKTVLIVDGYDGVFGNENIDKSISLHYLEALSQNSNISVIETVNSNSIESVGVSLNDYDVVVWVSAFEQTDDDNFSSSNRPKVESFLENGGLMILSGANIAYDLDYNGLRFTEQDFYTDYLKAKYETNEVTSLNVSGETGTFFEDLSLDLTEYVIPVYLDAITTWGGSEVLMKYGVDKVAAIGFRGAYAGTLNRSRLVHFSFPIELVDQTELNSIVDNCFEYFNEEMGLLIPDAPGASSFSVLPNDANDGVVFNFSNQTSLYVNSHNISFKDKSGVWKIAANDLQGMLSAELKYADFENTIDVSEVVMYKVQAIAQANGASVEGSESPESYLYINSNGGDINVMVVDGYDRHDKGIDFIQNYINTLSGAENISAIFGTENEAVPSGVIFEADFDNVYWVLGEESSTDMTFSTSEQKWVESYLKQGGKIFVSGSEIGWDLFKKGTSADRSFYMNYLKLKSYNGDTDDGNGNMTRVSGVDGSLFQDEIVVFSRAWKITYPDVLKPNTGAQAVFNYANGYTGIGAAGVYYEGSFGGSSIDGKVMTFGFPIETVSATDFDRLIMKIYREYNFDDNGLALEYNLVAGLDVSVYPNPISDNSLNIELNETDVKINVMSIEGRLVYSGVAKSKTIRLDTHSWSKGLYLVKFTSSNNKQVVKVIKE